MNCMCLKNVVHTIDNIETEKIYTITDILPTSPASLRFLGNITIAAPFGQAFLTLVKAHQQTFRHFRFVYLDFSVSSFPQSLLYRLFSIIILSASVFFGGFFLFVFSGGGGNQFLPFAFIGHQRRFQEFFCFSFHFHLQEFARSCLSPQWPCKTLGRAD